MDALALLCTLHADGPSSLKRLRSRGCGDLSTLLSRTPDVVAEDLSIERPAARRLIREARLLADRVGITALEVEEAPPTAESAAPTRSLVQEKAPEVQPSGGLDPVDRALVERITRPAPVRPQAPGFEPEDDVPSTVEVPGEDAPTESLGSVSEALPGWMEGPVVPHADDPFSVPGVDFAPQTTADATAEDLVTAEDNDSTAAPTGFPAAGHGEPISEAFATLRDDAHTVEPPVEPLVTPAGPQATDELESASVVEPGPDPDPQPSPAPQPGPHAEEIAEALARVLPESEPTTHSPLAFGAAVFAVEEPSAEVVEVDLSSEPVPEEPVAPPSSGPADEVDRGAPAQEAPEPAVAEPAVAEPAVADPTVAAAEADKAPAAPAPTAELPAPIPAIAEEVAAASSAASSGMDDALVEDLERLGISSFAELSTAESLALTRGLGVTFAQARRLRFLARRAEAEGTAWPAGGASAEAQPEASDDQALEGTVDASEELHSEPVETSSTEAPSTETPATETPATETPATEAPAFAAEVFAVEPPLEPILEAPLETPVLDEGRDAALAEQRVEVREPLPFAAAIEPEPEAAPEVPPVPAEPPAPLTTLSETEEAPERPAPEPELEPQGVRVDPSEVKARPRFGDQFARAAQQRHLSSEPGRTVLGWNFEIPRPEPEALPLASLSATPPGDDQAAEAVSGTPASSDEDPGGPFADA